MVIEDKVWADQVATNSAPEAEGAPARPKVPAYGSKEHYDRFESSLKGKASKSDIKGRMAAARGQATHPNSAAKAPANTPKTRKANAGSGVVREKANGGPSR